MTFAQVFDIGAAFALAFFLVRGAMRGLTGEIVSLLGLVFSVVCGWKFAGPAGALLSDIFPSLSLTVAELICAVAIFIVVSLAFAVVGKIMKAVVKAAKLSLLDHAFGAVSGAARAFVIVVCIYGVLSVFPVIPNEWMEYSLAMKCASAGWPPVRDFMTDRGWLDTSRLLPDEADILPFLTMPVSGDA